MSSSGNFPRQAVTSQAWAFKFLSEKLGSNSLLVNSNLMTYWSSCAAQSSPAVNMAKQLYLYWQTAHLCQKNISLFSYFYDNLGKIRNWTLNSKSVPTLRHTGSSRVPVRISYLFPSAHAWLGRILQNKMR